MERGRGAWPSSGAGGTLKTPDQRVTLPGPYYMYAFDDPRHT